jgi:hypothetical protein
MMVGVGVSQQNGLDLFGVKREIAVIRLGAFTAHKSSAVHQEKPGRGLQKMARSGNLLSSPIKGQSGNGVKGSWGNPVSLQSSRGLNQTGS